MENGADIAGGQVMPFGFSLQVDIQLDEFMVTAIAVITTAQRQTQRNWTNKAYQVV